MEKMDIFVEQIIHKKFGSRDYLVFAGILVGCVAIMFLIMMFIPIPMLIMLALIGICVGSYYLISSRNVEFEYSVTNGDLTVDKIINRRKRKRMVSFDVKNAENIGLYKAEAHASKPYEKRIFASRRDDGSSEGTWFIAARTPKTGYTLLVFNPEERVINSIKTFLPRQLQQSAFPRN